MRHSHHYRQLIVTKFLLRPRAVLFRNMTWRLFSFCRPTTRRLRMKFLTALNSCRVSYPLQHSLQADFFFLDRHHSPWQLPSLQPWTYSRACSPREGGWCARLLHTYEGPLRLHHCPPFPAGESAQESTGHRSVLHSYWRSRFCWYCQDLSRICHQVEDRPG